MFCPNKFFDFFLLYDIIKKNLRTFTIDKIAFTMPQKTFEDLICLMAENNKNALDEFYQIYGKIISGIAISVCKRQDEADEVVDDVLVKVWNSAIDLHNIKKPKAWLYRVTFNFAINKIKSRQDYDIISDKPVDEHGYAEVIDKLTFYDIIANLNKREQQILSFKIVNDLTFADIAEIMDKPINTIAYKYYRALKKLKGQLDKFL